MASRCFRCGVVRLLTPELIEAGIRAVLTEGLAPAHTVTKKGLQLTGSTKTLNPDLVFDDATAIGDVKYKLTGPDWRTSDLYQVVAFATGYRTNRAAIVGFATGGESLAPLQVGDVEVRYFAWDASVATTPVGAAQDLVDAIRDWLDDSSLVTA
jgi:hypothetical protein